MSKNFQYKWPASEETAPSTLHNDKDRTMAVWLIIFLAGFLTLFFLGYKKNSEGADVQKKAQSLYKVDMEPFLVRVLSEEGMVLTRVRVQVFVEDISTQSVVKEQKDQYKEQMIFFLAHIRADDFQSARLKRELSEKIKNHINSFLSEGKIQHVIIENQFIEEEISNG